MAILSERATIHELSDFTRPDGVTRDLSSQWYATTDLLDRDFEGSGVPHPD